MEETCSFQSAEWVCSQQQAVIPVPGKSCRRSRNAHVANAQPAKKLKNRPFRRGSGEVGVGGVGGCIGKLSLTGRSRPSSQPPRTSSGWCCAGSAGTAGPPWPSCTAASDARSRDLLWSLVCLWHTDKKVEKQDELFTSLFCFALRKPHGEEKIKKDILQTFSSREHKGKEGVIKIACRWLVLQSWV